MLDERDGTCARGKGEGVSQNPNQVFWNSGKERNATPGAVIASQPVLFRSAERAQPAWVLRLIRILAADWLPPKSRE
jgi:hypothetical protein